VYANVASGYPLDLAATHTVDSIKEIGLPAGYTYRFSGQVKVLEETTWNLLLAMLLASVFMYMVLAAQFESFSYPFIIMLTLPLSVPFALFSLWITGRALSLWSALGMFLLLGIVKKNGILQVDYTNRLVGQGMPVREAILEANRVRLRPILMTTLDHRGPDSGRHRDWCRLGTARLHRRHHHRRANALPAADFARRARRIFLPRRVRSAPLARMVRPYLPPAP
jgi:Cu/Ag efflux pump CusA